jgi:hypothetical protein
MSLLRGFSSRYSLVLDSKLSREPVFHLPIPPRKTAAGRFHLLVALVHQRCGQGSEFHPVQSMARLENDVSQLAPRLHKRLLSTNLLLCESLRSNGHDGLSAD